MQFDEENKTSENISNFTNKRYLSDDPAVVAAKKQYMLGFNKNCKTCISKNESVNSMTENSQLWKKGNAFTFNIFCTLKPQQKCCAAQYINDKEMKFVYSSVEDPVCTTGLCSWDTLESKKTDL